MVSTTRFFSSGEKFHLKVFEFLKHAYLRGTSDHVLDEVTVTRGIDDGHVELGSLELPQGNVNGDTTLTLGLQGSCKRKNSLITSTLYI